MKALTLLALTFLGHSTAAFAAPEFFDPRAPLVCATGAVHEIPADLQVRFEKAFRVEKHEGSVAFSTENLDCVLDLVNRPGDPIRPRIIKVGREVRTSEEAVVITRTCKGCLDYELSISFSDKAISQVRCTAKDNHRLELPEPFSTVERLITELSGVFRFKLRLDRVCDQDTPIEI